MLKKTPLKRGNTSLKRSPLKKSNTPIKRGGKLKKSNKTPQQLEEDQLKRDMRTQFYKECVEKVGLRSAISGRRLSGERINYHHVKPKSKYPEVEFCFEVILPVTLDEHALLESNPEFFKENLDKIQFIEDNWEGCIQLSKEWETKYEKQ